MKTSQDGFHVSKRHSSTQPDPSDLNAVCSGNNATTIKRYINSHCGNNVNVAMSAFSGVCSGAGSGEGAPVLTQTIIRLIVGRKPKPFYQRHWNYRWILCKLDFIRWCCRKR